MRPPPDVSDGQLLVEGIEADSSIAGGLPQQSAVAAVVFSLSPDEIVGRLRLRVDSSSPRASIRVCRVTTGFAATHNGAWSDVPSYDCEGAADAVVDGDVLDFRDVGHLRQDTQLAVILLPSSPGRVVIESPGDDALEVIDPASAFAPSGSFRTGSPKTQGSTPSAPSSGRTAPVAVATSIDHPALGASSEAVADVAQADPFHVSPRRDDFVSRHDLGARAAAAAVLLALLVPFALRGTRRGGTTAAARRGAIPVR